VELDVLARRAGVKLDGDSVIGIDVLRNQLDRIAGASLAFDLASIDTGPVAAVRKLPGSSEHALPIRPIEAFVPRRGRRQTSVGTEPKFRFIRAEPVRSTVAFPPLRAPY
jgi:NADH dehydrogenase FAD-containing subunit